MGVEAVWVCGGCMVVVFVECVWYLWSVVCVDSVVGGLVCGCWIGAEYVCKPVAGLVEVKVSAVYGWCINSK